MAHDTSRRLYSVAVVGGAVLLGSTFLSTAASAQSVDELKAQIDALTQKVEAMESRSQQNVATPVIAPAQAVTAGDFPGAIKLPGTNTSFKVGGYVKADVMYSSNQGMGDAWSVGAIPIDGTFAENPSGPFRIHARQTRFNIQTRTPTEFGMVRTYIEGDWFGGAGTETASNSWTFRMRHAYGTIGNLLIGQTWSTFMQLGTLADTIDFGGPTGVTFVRQAMIRYSIPFGSGFSADLAVENPQSIVGGTAVGVVSGQGAVGSNADNIPDFVGKLSYGGSWGFVSVVALVGALDTDDPTGPGHINDTKISWGVHLGTRINTWGKDSVAASFVIGDGIGRYLSPGGACCAMGLINPATGNIDRLAAWGAQGSYEHWWTDNLYSTVAFGWQQNQTPVWAGAAIGRSTTLHANLQWVPVPRVTLGLEGMIGWVGLYNNPPGSVLDDVSSAWRIQFGAKWAF